MNQYLIPLNDDMYESIDEFILEQCTYYGDENNCKSQKTVIRWSNCDIVRMHSRKISPH